MNNNLRLGIAQMTSTPYYQDNIQKLQQFGQLASDTSCDLLALPEISGLIQNIEDETSIRPYPAKTDPFIGAACNCAAKYAIWIHIGSPPVRGVGKLLNQSILIDYKGNIRGRYNKIHLFDYFPDARNSFKESDRYESDLKAVAVRTPWGIWGMLICYDLRFPQIFQDYAKIGAKLIFVPSAFTVKTGQAHWHTLLQSRAIETNCWIAAAAQVGTHIGGRKTYGHSLIISPWGRITTDLGGDGTEFAAQTIDLNAVEIARRKIPTIHNSRNYTLRIDEEK